MKAGTATLVEPDAVVEIAPLSVPDGSSEIKDLRERVARLEAELAALRASVEMSRIPSGSETGQMVSPRKAKRERVIDILSDPANHGLSLRAVAKLASVSPETVRAIRASNPKLSTR